MRLSKSEAWEFINDLDNSLTGNLMSSLSCDIHKSFPMAVLNLECMSFSHLTWSSFVCILTPFVVDIPVTPKRPNRLSMSFCGNSIVIWPDILTLTIRPKNSTGWSGVRCSTCLRLKVSWISWMNFCTAWASPAMTKSSTYAMTMRLRWPEESKPVKVQGSDFICERLRLLRTWFKWTCHDLSESLRP